MKTAQHDPNWGGAGRGQGQKPLYPDAGPLIPVAIRLTQAQKDKLVRLGGGQWIRDRIDKAKDPA